MNVEIQAIVPWLALVVGLGSLAYTMKRDRSQAIDEKLEGIGTFIGTRASKEHVANIADKVDKLEDRATRIESELLHLPDHKTVNTIELKMTELSGEIRTLAAQIRPVTAIAERIQERLMEQTGV
jgi:archaellum component FlaC